MAATNKKSNKLKEPVGYAQRNLPMVLNHITLTFTSTANGVMSS